MRNPITVKIQKEPEPLVRQGYIYRAYQVLEDGRLLRLFMGAETIESLIERVQENENVSRFVF